VRIVADVAGEGEARAPKLGGEPAYGPRLPGVLFWARMIPGTTVVEAGATLGPYTVLEPLGAGGMGEVYRALDTRLQRQVAVKVLPASLVGDAEFLRRFEQEARAIGALSHPNVLAVFDVGSHEGVPYLVTELLEGETLRARLRGGALPPRKALEVGIQVARGLAAAHERGLIHRDLKPENIFVTSDGQVKLLDFGLAKLSREAQGQDGSSELATAPAGTTPGTVMGTVGYMAPEQLRGQPVDQRADIFAFGAVLYEMLTGRRAFAGDTAADTITAILREDPPELTALCPNLPPGLERIVRRCLEKQPAERFQSARDVGFALEGLAAPSGPSGFRLTSRRVPSSLLLAGAAAVALAGTAFLGYLAGAAGQGGGVATYRQLTFRRGVVTAARFAPDGATVYYSAAWEGRPAEVYATRLDSRDSQVVGGLAARVLAAAASELAVLLPGRGGPMGTVALVPLGTLAPRPVAEEVFDADWDPAGGELAIVHEVDGRARLEYPIGRDLFTADGWMQNPRIAPDRQRVAVVHHPVGGDTRGLVVVVEIGRSRKVVSREWKDIGGLAWSADGREVWFTATSTGADRALYAMTLAGRERIVTQAPGRLGLHDISPTGTLLLTRSVSRREARGVLPGSERERDFTWLDGTYVADLAADGSLMLFGESAEGGGPGYSVFLRGADGSAPVRLGEGLALGLSPDRRWALTLRVGEEQALVLLPTGAGRPVVLPRGPIARYHWGCWFPDGARVLVLASEPSSGPRMYVQAIPDGMPQPIGTERVSLFRWNAITPDGTALVAGCPKGVEAALCLVAVADGSARPLSGLPAGSQPIRWSGDGRYLFLRGPRAELPVRIWRFDGRTRTAERWLELGPSDVAGVTNVSDVLLTADGRHYVYHYQRTLSDLYAVDGLR
jgi:hypothetical protein